MYDDLRTKFLEMAEKYNILNEQITIIYARTLSSKEAIGNPERKDFPLLKGKEVMIEATFKEAKGQAYTNMPGNFRGSIKDVISLSLSNNFQRAVFIASLNAVMRYFNTISNTIHCRDTAPEICAIQLVEYIKNRCNNAKIAFIGFQPAMIYRLSQSFSIRVVDLDNDNIGKNKLGVIIEGPEKTDEILSWSDIILATGSTSVNGTINKFLNKKPIIFYGVTVAAIAKLYGYENYCPCAH